jgi:hypothetical protein
MLRSFKTFAPNVAKNIHIEHVEDLMFTKGSSGVSIAVELLEKTVEYIVNGKSDDIVLNMKWDGSPMIIYGRHHHTNQIFISTKGFFNVMPKVAFTNDQLYQQFSPELASQLQGVLDSLKELPNLQGVYGADLLYSSTPTYQNGDFIFNPNTITYSVSSDSDVGREIRSSKVGLAVHTFYEYVNGAYQPHHFDENEYLGGHIWCAPTSFESGSNRSDISQNDFEEISRSLTLVSDTLRVWQRDIDELSDNQKISSFIISYVNHKSRKGNTSLRYDEFVAYIRNLQSDSRVQLKSARGISNRDRMDKLLLDGIRSRRTAIEMCFDIHKNLTKAKMAILNGESGPISHGSEIKCTRPDGSNGSPEGLVVFDVHLRRKAKLVNRSEFTTDNFNNPKWQS